MKRSMDDVRFVPGSDEVINAEKLEGDWTLVWHCPWCDDECSVALKDIESVIESEERDPDIEYLVCTDCHWGADITNKSVLAFVINGSEKHKGHIKADGYFTYLVCSDAVYRLN